jgi:nitroreductase
MNVEEAIRSRRSIFHFRAEPVPAETLDRLLEFGIWAPNHHLTEPWRFTVLGESVRQTLAERYGDLQVKKAPADIASEIRERLCAAGVAKFLSKPSIVVVSCLQQGDEQRRREDYAAAYCAVQNVQLAAWAEGVGMQISTNALIHDPETYTLLGIDPEQEQILSFLYAGYPAEIPTQHRRPLADVVRHTA